METHMSDDLLTDADVKQHGDRKFYDIPVESQPHKHEASSNLPRTKLLNYINENVVGKDKTFSGPFGLRKVLYCDYTASGRALKFIEDYIGEKVLPEYGNTHTTTTVTSLQTTLYRHEARDIVRNAVNASEHDAVVFVGTGSTGAVHKLIHALHLQSPPVVFIGPHEHHSSFLPWKEIGAQVIRIRETPEGLLDVLHLEDELKKWQGRGQQLIGSFCAASNITGVLVDVDAVTICLHAYGALAFWDYATAAPYVKIDMNPVVESASRSLVYKDAVFISSHKFVGGVDAPGILVAKKKLFRNPVPSGAGGGSVFFVRRDSHRYLQEAEMREEGGTPAIVGAVRAGLTFQLKEAVTPEVIMAREHELYRTALAAWSETPQLMLLGSSHIERLPVFSFLIRQPDTGLYLHHNFVCTILNDVFGIQSRGGCQCAGPYAQDLLGIDEKLAQRYEEMLLEDSRLNRTHLRRYREYSEREIIRPGFSRLNLPYFMNEEEVDFVLTAVKMVAINGWKLLPQYIFNPETGEWRHRNHQVFKDRKWLGSIDYSSGRMQYAEPVFTQKGALPGSYQDCIAKAEDLFKQADKVRVEMPDQSLLFDGEAKTLRWFLLPSEAYQMLRSKTSSSSSGHVAPFTPAVYERPSEDEIKERKAWYAKLNSDSCKIQKLHQKPVTDSSVNNSNSKAAMPGYSETERSGDYVTECGSDQGDRTSNANTAECEENRSQTKSFSSGLTSEMSEGFRSDEITKPESTTAVSNRDSGHNLDDHVEMSDIRDGSIQCHATTGQMQTAGRQRGEGITSTEKLDAENRFQVNISQKDRSQCGSVQQNGDTEKQDNDKNKESERSTESESTVENRADMSDLPQRESDSCRVNNECTVCESSPNPITGQQNACRKSGPTQAPPVHKWQAPPKKIFNPTAEAIKQYNMLRDGDRVLVCLSGGKDSLSLLHTMHQLQFFLKKHQNIQFELGAVTVDPQTPSFDPSPLKKYLAVLGVPYFYEEQCIIQMAQQLPYECASICSYCSRMKRGRLYTAARREGYNVLAMGQHLDDLAESFLMSVFHNGIIRTMKASYTVQEGDLRIIRPFVYVREQELRKFAEERFLPVIPENCPGCFEAPKERHRMKQLLASQEILFPRLFFSLMSAMKPILAIDRTGVSFKDISQNAIDNKNNSAIEKCDKALQVKVTQVHQAVP